MNKYEELLNYSNPEKVNRNLQRYLSGTKLFISTRKNKKYMVQRPDGTWTHFGQMGFQDFTFHKDDIRRINYLNRANGIRGHWKDDPYSPNNMSIHGTWM